jgi:methionyl-tRNA formyltransferase
MVLDDNLLVACGDGGAVRLTRLQKPGGKPLDAEVFLNGQPIPPDTILS